MAVTSTGSGAASEPLVAIRGLSKTFGGQKALDGVDLDVRRGQVHALIGQNGSGKSTLLKVLTGFHRPDPGVVVSVQGRQVALSDLHRHVTVRAVHQDLGLIPRMSVVDNISLGTGFPRSRLRLVDRAVQLDSAASLLAEVGLDVGDVTRSVNSLTTVERTMVAIARVMSGWDFDRSVLILDEPTSALPDREAERLHDLARMISARGVGVLYVSHSMSEIAAVADVVTVLRDGRVAASSAAAGLAERDLLMMMLGERRLTELDELEHRGSLRRSRASADLGVVAVDNVVGHQLNGVSIKVRPGEIVGVAGLAGSGHLELAYTVGGAHRAAAGTLSLDDRSVDMRTITPRTAMDLGVALVPPDRESEGYIAIMDVTSNVVMPQIRRFRRSGRVVRRLERRHAAAWIDRLGIRPADDRKRVGSLSGGNRQKVVLAKWMDMAKSLLVLAEPTVGVDLGAKMQIYQTLRQISESGQAVLVSSTDNTDLVAICDRVVCLASGRVVDALHGEAIAEDRIINAISGVGARERDRGAR